MFLIVIDRFATNHYRKLLTVVSTLPGTLNDSHAQRLAPSTAAMSQDRGGGHGGRFDPQDVAPEADRPLA